jgi:phospholipase C
MLQFLSAWTGAKPADITSWRESVTGDLTAAFDFEHPDFSIPANIPSLDETWALSQRTGGATTTPAEGDRHMPAQEPGSRPHRPSNHQPQVVTTAPQRGSSPALRINLANEGHQDFVYTLTPNDYEGREQTMTIGSGGSRAVAWPMDADGYYDVIITANTGDGFKRRYAGRIA